MKRREGGRNKESLSPSPLASLSYKRPKKKRLHSTHVCVAGGEDRIKGVVLCLSCSTQVLLLLMWIPIPRMDQAEVPPHQRKETRQCWWWFVPFNI